MLDFHLMVNSLQNLVKFISVLCEFNRVCTITSKWASSASLVYTPRDRQRCSDGHVGLFLPKRAHHRKQRGGLAKTGSLPFLSSKFIKVSLTLYGPSLLPLQ